MTDTAEEIERIEEIQCGACSCWVHAEPCDWCNSLTEDECSAHRNGELGAMLSERLEELYGPPQRPRPEARVMSTIDDLRRRFRRKTPVELAAEVEAAATLKAKADKVYADFNGAAGEFKQQYHNSGPPVPATPTAGQKYDPTTLWQNGKTKAYKLWRVEVAFEGGVYCVIASFGGARRKHQLHLSNRKTVASYDDHATAANHADLLISKKLSRGYQRMEAE